MAQQVGQVVWLVFAGNDILPQKGASSLFSMCEDEQKARDDYRDCRSWFQWSSLVRVVRKENGEWIVRSIERDNGDDMSGW